MKHCGRDESECLFIGCNCGCPACVEVKVANGTMAKGSHANEGVRPALVRALEDVKRGLATIESLDADVTLARDALATAKDDVLTVVRGGTCDLAKTANAIDVALQSLFNSRALRGRQ